MLLFPSPCSKQQHRMCWRGGSWLGGSALKLGDSSGKILGIWGGQGNWREVVRGRRGEMCGNPKLLLWAVPVGVESLGNMFGGRWNMTSIEQLLFWRQEMVQEIPK